MTEKQCSTCKYWAFLKYSRSQYDDRHYCNLALKEGRFDHNECLRPPYDICDEWKRSGRLEDE